MIFERNRLPIVIFIHDLLIMNYEFLSSLLHSGTRFLIKFKGALQSRDYLARKTFFVKVKLGCASSRPIYCQTARTRVRTHVRTGDEKRHLFFRFFFFSLVSPGDTLRSGVSKGNRRSPPLRYQFRLETSRNSSLPLQLHTMFFHGLHVHTLCVSRLNSTHLLTRRFLSRLPCSLSNKN